VPFDKRLELESLGNRCWQVTLHFGFKNDPDVPFALKLLARPAASPLDEMDTSYFLSRDIVMPTIGSGMALWREKLFASMHRNAAAWPTSSPAGQPRRRAGAKVEI
jgi:KUP system potassium uptake protein